MLFFSVIPKTGNLDTNIAPNQAMGGRGNCRGVATAAPLLRLLEVEDGLGRPRGTRRVTRSEASRSSDPTALAKRNPGWRLFGKMLRLVGYSFSADHRPATTQTSGICGWSYVEKSLCLA